MAKRAAKTTQITEIYQLKITLEGSKPPIWRRIQVSSNIILGELHFILQKVMGWDNGHLHAFEVGGNQYSTPGMDLDMLNEDLVRLKQVGGEKAKFSYEYDFGDGWEHQIEVEKVLPPEEGQHYPICLKGKRACPPEDCGGIWGYEEMVAIMADPNHPEYKDRLEWLGEEFDPEAFDLDVLNQRLSKMC